MKKKWAIFRYINQLIFEVDRKFYPIALTKVIVKAWLPMARLLVSGGLVNYLLQTTHQSDLTGYLLYTLKMMGLLILAEMLLVYSNQWIENKFSDRLRLLTLAQVLSYQVLMDYPLIIGEENSAAFKGAVYAADHNGTPLMGFILRGVELVGAGIGMILYTTLLFQLDSVMLGLILILVIFLLVIKHFQLKLKRSNRDERLSNETQYQYARKVMSDHRVGKDIRLYSMMDWISEIQAQLMKQYYQLIRPTNRLNRIESIGVLLMTLLMSGLAYYYSLQSLIKEEIAVGDFIVYVGLVTVVITVLSQLIEESAMTLEYLIDIEPFYDYMHLAPIFKGEQPLATEGVPFEIKLEKVTYRYPNRQEAIIDQMDLTIHPGEKLAIVGTNGAGKTTLVKLILGLLEPTSGCILINGTDLREFDRKAYYQQIAPVFQDTHLFTFNIRDTILQGAPYDPGKYQAALEQSGMDQVIDKLPEGDQTKIVRQVDYDGVELSGGQMQKLKLAQALYKDAPILILDEPTAALDPLSESEVYQHYLAFSKGKTALFISHRLASTQFCDRIIYLDDGYIKEMGTHEELLASHEAYAEMFHHQAYYYRDLGDGNEEPEAVSEQGGVI
ncbi:ABC transporter ATP-binding protein [Falseniella ignava]|uniref:ABC transporter domain-containing protein n=1 Tax=Falseniella ignava CCUG 37419 TaxID=883112 RepID=K1MLB9_9LACT|nr:ABC transporter ATP-binding protein [Falseniella ignava]EKB56754.1 hypothetical protein HMPREF9707_00812 [Falseniella ignava CCUG 37419]